MRHPGLLCAENTVAGIAQTGNDVSVVVEFLVNSSQIHLHIGVCSLNSGNTESPVWFQTLGTDACPVLDSSHMIVILNEDGTYSNKKGDAIDKTEMSQQLPAVVNVYDMQGRLVKTNVKAGESLNGLPRGLYIVGGKKMLK